MTLREYADARNHVIVWYTSLSQANGCYELYGYDSVDEFAERRELLDLDGRVDGNDVWAWDGRGSPKDDRGCDIRLLQAYSDKDTWMAMVWFPTLEEAPDSCR
jgi:hypothetical protein